MHPKVVDAFEEIDADIYNGDSIENNKELAKMYIARWIERMPDLYPLTPPKPSGRTNCEHHTQSEQHCLQCRILKSQAELRRMLTAGEVAALVKDTEHTSPAIPAITFESRTERDAAARLIMSAREYAASRND